MELRFKKKKNKIMSTYTVSFNVVDWKKFTPWREGKHFNSGGRNCRFIGISRRDQRWGWLRLSRCIGNTFRLTIDGHILSGNGRIRRRWSNRFWSVVVMEWLGIRFVRCLHLIKVSQRPSGPNHSWAKIRPVGLCNSQFCFLFKIINNILLFIKDV